MGIVKYFGYFLKCDNLNCQHGDFGEVTGFFTYREAIEWGKENGWEFRDRNKRAYCCPECQKEAEGD